MRTALDGVDVVHVRVDSLTETGIVLEGDVNGNHLVRIHADGLRDELFLPGVQVVDEFTQTLLAVEDIRAVHLLAGGMTLPVGRGLELVHQGTEVRKGDADALVEVCQFAEAVGQGFVLVDDGLGEDGGVRMEGDGGAGVIGLPYNFHLGDGLALGVLLLEHLSLAVDFCHQEV